MWQKIKFIIARRKVLKRADKIINQALCLKPNYHDEKSIIHFCLFMARAYRLSQIQNKYILKKF